MAIKLQFEKFVNNITLLYYVYATILIETSLIFTALHEMQTRSSDENSVCLSVCPSVCHTRVL